MKRNKLEVAEMPPLDYQAQVIAWSRGSDIASADDIAEAVLMVERWNKVRKQRQQMEIV